MAEDNVTIFSMGRHDLWVALSNRETLTDERALSATASSDYLAASSQQSDRRIVCNVLRSKALAHTL